METEMTTTTTTMAPPQEVRLPVKTTFLLAISVPLMLAQVVLLGAFLLLPHWGTVQQVATCVASAAKWTRDRNWNAPCRRGAFQVCVREQTSNSDLEISAFVEDTEPTPQAVLETTSLSFWDTRTLVGLWVIFLAATERARSKTYLDTTGYVMNTLVHPKEKFYFAICLVVSVLTYFLLALSLVGLLYIVVGLVISLFVHGLFVGRLQGNGIRVTERQFPEIHRLTRDLAEQMEMQVPAVYVLQSGGLLNAFATRFLGRNFVVLYSDVLEIA
jgi:hypothetical protein